MNTTSQAVENLSDYYSNTNVHNIATSAINMAASEIYKDPTWTGYQHNKFYIQGGYAEIDVKKISTDLIELTSKGYFDYHFDGKNETKESLVKVILRSSKFSKFAYYSQVEGNIWWTNNDTVWGPFHTQDNISAYRKPVFNGKVTTKGKVKYYTSSSKDKPRFMGGFEKGVDLPRPTTVLSDLYTTASSGGHMFSGASDVYLTFKDDSVTYKINSSGPETTVLTANLAPNGVIYADNANLRIKGRVEGQFTLVSEKKVYLDDDITYKSDPRINSNSLDLLGIIAKKEILVTDNTPNRSDINIHASMYSIDEGFGAENYSSRPNSGTINLLGGMIQYQRQAVGQFSWWGTQNGFNKRYRCDSRLMKMAPPAYPGTGKFEIVSWFE
jgi:hypothetical protein